MLAPKPMFRIASIDGPNYIGIKFMLNTDGKFKFTPIIK